MAIAFVFPGQGSQDVGMGAELAKAFPAARRVFEELLTNVSRHAAATRVRITMKGERGKFALHVYDNGRGIPRDAVESEQSLGLIGMRERATLLGGTLTVSPGRRRGTLAVVRIPVKPRMVARAAASPIANDGSGEPVHD